MLRLFSRSFSSSRAPIGFVGLGNMGAFMAKNLLKHGNPLVVYDLNKTAMEGLAAHAKSLNLSASAAATPGEVSRLCPVVISMLPSSPHVKEVYQTGKFSMLQQAKKGSLFIDSSTIDPGTSREMSAAAHSVGCSLVDAPVSGGVGGAEAGTLTFMVGGSQEEFERSKAILSQMGKNLVHCGASGTGQIAKICNNLVLAICMTGVSEAMNLGIQSGIDAGKLAGIFNTSTARCWSSEVYNPVPGIVATAPAGRGYTGGFGSALMKKDLTLAELAAKQAGVPLPLGELVRSLYDDLLSQGGGAKDFSFIYQFLKENKKIQ